jgi:hypothetical protein
MIRAVLDILGHLVLVIGSIVTTAACFLADSIPPAATFPFWVGLSLMSAGWAITSIVPCRTCPRCAEPVRRKASLCQYCGGTLDGRADTHR